MSKWRPSKECIYCIPDIHGMYDELELILSRILPLRKTKGVTDKIVFLGDYIDRRPDSHKVLDKLIELKQEYGDQIITLRGNHESMFLDGIAPSESSKRYRFWMQYGGDITLKGYLDRSGNSYKEEKLNPYLFPRQRIIDLVPKEHIDFINSLDDYYETDDFIFVHGGCDPLRPMNDNLQPNQISCGMIPRDIFIWDRALYNLMCSVNGNAVLPWQKCIVTGHNCDTGDPLIMSKFMMIDCSCDNKLFVMEMNSREAFIAKIGNKRLIKSVYV